MLCQIYEFRQARKTPAMQQRKQEKYTELMGKIQSVLQQESDPILWMSTLCCLIREEMGFYWVGFYRLRNRELIIGPYQGTLGCLHIPLNRGVCGACATRQETVVVPDVDKFPGHIACDPRSRSEIVVPVFDSRRQLRAVLDIDSEEPSKFDQTDQQYLEQIVKQMRSLAWTEHN